MYSQSSISVAYCYGVSKVECILSYPSLRYVREIAIMDKQAATGDMSLTITVDVQQVVPMSTVRVRVTVEFREEPVASWFQTRIS